MATLVSAAVTLPFSKSTTASIGSSRTSVLTTERVNFNKVPLHYKSVSAGGRLVSIRSQMTIETASSALAEIEKGKIAVEKKVEAAALNRFKRETTFDAICMENNRITGDDSPDTTHHILFNTEGKFSYKEGQVVAVDNNGQSRDSTLFFIASSARGDCGDSKTLSLCVRRAFHYNDQGELVPSFTSNFLCDMKRGDRVQMTGPNAIELLMPEDPNATVIMLATGTGIAPFRGFLWKMFFEKHDDYKFNGLAWLFFGVPTSSSLLYKKEFDDMLEKNPKNFNVNYATGGGQNGEHLHDVMAQYGDTLWELIGKGNTFVYVCGLKGMEKGIDQLMVSLADKNGIDWFKYKKELKEAGRWKQVVY